ncbi:MAG TPA: 2-phospho-L-lactate guanylyltransferase [Ktedonobacteraceae bacterium]
MTYTALIPVKSLASAKSRLAPYLSQNQRETLVLDMLHHVLRVLFESRLLARVSVVSPDTQILAQAQAWGAQALMEEQQGHNAALHAAALRDKAAGATALLTTSADLPLLCIHDIQALIEQSKQYQVVLAASLDGTGTNAILARPPLALPYLFGPNSLQRYLDAARQKHLSSVLLRRIGLAFDVDTIGDLRELQVLRSESRDEIELATCHSA